MNLPYRIELLKRLGDYILSDDPSWLTAKQRSGQENGWFIPEFVELASTQIAKSFLRESSLREWADKNGISHEKPAQKSVGIVMAGNIPMVGFHDWLSVFASGHQARIKPSSKDNVLIRHLLNKLIEWEPSLSNNISFEEMLKNCDAYIATGSNNSSRYFEYYFGKYAHIIRRNRTSVAILSGEETREELEILADDVYLFFGLGCRNVTKLYVPSGYDFLPLLEAFKKYDRLAEHNKYKNNYDYQLALHILNKDYYMSNASILLFESKSLFSPISQLNYEYYADRNVVINSLESSTELQCIVGRDYIPFGQAQYPRLEDFADGVNTLEFLSSL